ncbi:MAG: YfiR family protein [Candidatus Omnitrophota bacterium]
MIRRSYGGVLILFFLTFIIMTRAYAIQADDLKVAFLYNFAKYVEWPASGPGGTISICAYGSSPGILKTIEQKIVNGKAVQTKYLSDAGEATGCQIVFVRSGEETAGMLAAVKAASVLTVGEEKGFLDNGGIINFKVTGEKISFDVNATLAQANGLTISSQLLKLADEVR